MNTIRFFPHMMWLEIVVWVLLVGFAIVLWLVARAREGAFAAGRWVRE